MTKTKEKAPTASGAEEIRQEGFETPDATNNAVDHDLRTQVFTWAIAPNKYAERVRNCQGSWLELAAAFQGPNTEKGMQFVCGVQGPAGTTTTRSAETSLPRCWLPFDIDGVSAENVGAVLAYFEGIRHFRYRTSSWKPEDQRYRVVIALSRECSYEECTALGDCIADKLEGLGAKMDRSVHRPAQPVFSALKGIGLEMFNETFGLESLDVDASLQGATIESRNSGVWHGLTVELGLLRKRLGLQPSDRIPEADGERHSLLRRFCLSAAHNKSQDEIATMVGECVAHNFADDWTPEATEEVLKRIPGWLRKVERENTTADVVETAEDEDSDPEPVDFWATPPVPKPDVSMHCELVREHATRFALASGTDPGFVALSLLAVAASCMPASAEFSPYRNASSLTVRSNINVFGVMASGGGKGTVMEAAVSALDDVYAKLLQQRDRDSKDVVPRLKVTDATVEGWAKALAIGDNFPLGYFAEAAHFMNFGRYTVSGSAIGERAFVNMLMDTQRNYTRTRAAGDLHIPYLGASILTATTLLQIKDDALDAGKDGFFPRMHVYFLQPMTQGTDEDCADLRMQLFVLLSVLRSCKDVQVTVDTNVHAAFREWWVDTLLPLSTDLEEVSPGLAAFYRRLSNKAARFIFIDAAIRAASVSKRKGVELQRTDVLRAHVTIDDFQRAKKFVGHLVQHGEAFYQQKLLGDTGELAMSLARFILTNRKKGGTVGRRDFQRHHVGDWERASEPVRWRALRLLLDSAWLLGPAGEARALNPTQATRWDVNPLVFEKFADLERHETERRRALALRFKKVHAGA